MRHVFFIIILLSAYGNACSPPAFPFDRTVEGEIAKSYEYSEFIGYVYVEEKLLEGDREKYRFKVLNAFKGKKEDFIEIWFPDSGVCNMTLDAGEVYILHASKYDTNWSVSRFGPTTKIQFMTSEELKYIEEYAQIYREKSELSL